MQLNIDLTDYTCPISLQIMRDPVVASDGFTYEANEIEKWIGKNKTSPMTCEPITSTLHSNKSVLRTIIELESKNPSIRSERYQYDLPTWLKYYAGNNNDILNKDCDSLIMDILDQYNKFDFEDDDYCDIIEATIDYVSSRNKNNFCDIAAINICKLPDRNILYKLVCYGYRNEIIKLINHTLLDTEGLKYLLSHIFEYINNEDIDDDHVKQIYATLDKQHYNLFSYKEFKLYIDKCIDTIDKFNIFISKDIIYFNQSFHKYILHCFLSAGDKKIFFSYEKINRDINKIYILSVVSLFEKYQLVLDRPDPNGDSLLTCFFNGIRNNNYDNVVVDTLHCFISLISFGMIRNVGYSDFESFFLTPINCNRDTFSTDHKCNNDYKSILRIMFNMIDDNICNKDIDNIIENLLKDSYCGAEILFEWIEKNNISMDRIIFNSTIHSIYLSQTCVTIDNDAYNISIPQYVIKNINMFIEKDIRIEKSDLINLGHIIVSAEKGSYLTPSIISFLDKHVGAKKYDIINLAILISGLCCTPNFLKEIVVNTNNITKKYTLEWRQSTIVENLFSNQNINLEILKAIPESITITHDMIKIAGKNQTMTSDMYRYLIERMGNE